MIHINTLMRYNLLRVNRRTFVSTLFPLYFFVEGFVRNCKVVMIAKPRRRPRRMTRGVGMGAGVRSISITSTLYCPVFTRWCSLTGVGRVAW